MLKILIWIVDHLLTLIEFLDDFFNERSLLGIAIQRSSLNVTIVVVFWKI